MSNHFHLVFRTRQPNLSLAMGHLNGELRQWWNKRHHRVGHVFQGRFKAQIVEASVYLVRLCRYVLVEPGPRETCAPTRQTGPGAATRCSPATSSSDCVDVGVAVASAWISENTEAVRARLLDYVEPEADPEMAAFIRSDRRVIGTEAFAAQFRNQARARRRRKCRAETAASGTPALVEILADAIRRGEGLPGGVRRAHEARLFRRRTSPACAGLARDTVRRMVKAPEAARACPGPRHRPGTQRASKRRPGTPERAAIADLTPGAGVSASGAGRGST